MLDNFNDFMIFCVTKNSIALDLSSDFALHRLLDYAGLNLSNQLSGRRVC